MFQLILAFFAFTLSAEAASPFRKQVEALFEKHCTECHNKDVKEKDLDLTNLDNLLKRKAIINLGSPEKSKLVTRIQPNGGMPKNKKALDKKDVDAVMAWIEEEGRTLVTKEPSAPRKLEIKEELDVEDGKDPLEIQIMRVILADHLRLPEKDAVKARYLTLSHLWISKESEQNLDVYRQAVTKLLNSLSTEAELHHPVAIDKHKTILRFYPEKLGWHFSFWNKVAATNPYQQKFDHPVAKLVYQMTIEAPMPYLRADWFAQVVSRSPFYEQALNLPKTAVELEKKLIGDRDKNIREEKIVRAGFRESQVSDFNRMIERHDLNDYKGYYWRSYDFDGHDSDKDIYKFPFTPAEFTVKIFQHAGGEVIFSLKNGMQGYWLENKKGEFLDKAPDFVYDSTRRKARIKNTRIFAGISCMGCHVGGLHLTSDRILEYVQKNPRSFSDNEKKKIEKTHDPKKLASAFEEDRKVYSKVLKELGITEDGTLDCIRTFVDRFEQPVELDEAAAELGIPVEQLKNLSKEDAAVEAIVTELENEGVPRDLFIKSFKTLVAAQNPSSVEVAKERLLLKAPRLNTNEKPPKSVSFSGHIPVLEKTKPFTYSFNAINTGNRFVIPLSLADRRKFLIQDTTKPTAFSPHLYGGDVTFKRPESYAKDWPRGSAVSPNGEYYAISYTGVQKYPGSLLIYKTFDSSLTPIVELPGPQSFLQGISNSGDTVLTFRYDSPVEKTLFQVGKIKDNKVENFAEVTLRRDTALALSPDGKSLAVVSQENGELLLYQLDGKNTLTIQESTRVNPKFAFVKFSQSGRYLLVGGSGATGSSLKDVLYLYDVEKLQLLTEIDFPNDQYVSTHGFLSLFGAEVREKQKDILFQIKNESDTLLVGVSGYSFEKNAFAQNPLIYSSELRKVVPGAKLNISLDGEIGMIQDDKFFNLEFKY